MEELASIACELARQYAGYDSTSIPYERAESLMQGVLYCIRAAERAYPNAMLSRGGLPARRVYEMGRSCVERRAKEALETYNALMADFDSYGNRCLYDTMTRQIPAFFRRYDSVFAPQDAVGGFDYPAGRDLSGEEGIDYAAEYLRCMREEQAYLRSFPRESVLEALSRCDREYREAIMNLGTAVYRELSARE